MSSAPDDEPAFDDGISGYDHNPFTAAEIAEHERRAREYREANRPRQIAGHWPGRAMSRIELERN